MEFESKTVAVTGAGGFIGSHLAEELAAQGAEVRAFVFYNPVSGRGWLEDASEDIEVVHGDVRDHQTVRQLIDGADIAYNLAALVGIPYSYRAPEAYVETNVGGTLNVLRAADEHDLERVVHTSTSEVYGTAQYVPMDEDHPLQAQSPYAASKIGADKMVEAFQRSFGLSTVTLRPFNTYGPRQSARAVIPTIIMQALAREKVELGNLHPTRDFNFVSDTVDAFLRAATVEEAVGGTLNVGSGSEIAIGDLARRIIDFVDPGVDLVTTAERTRPDDSEVDRLVADGDRAQEVLGWKPKTSLSEGLERTIAWVEDNLDSYAPEEYAV